MQRRGAMGASGSVEVQREVLHEKPRSAHAGGIGGRLRVLRAAGDLAKKTVCRWIDDRGPSQAASLAFYAGLSLAPLVLIAVAVAGWAFGDAAARGELTRQFESMVGFDGAQAIQAILANARRSDAGVIGTLVGVVVLLVGASGVFVELQDGLNAVWRAKPRPGGTLFLVLRQRIVSFAMVLGVGFLLLVSLVVSAGLAGLGSRLSASLPGGSALATAVNVLLSVVVITALFASIFRLVPDVHVAWKDVWVGAAITALLFTIGKALIGAYLGHASVGSAYGAAGSLVVVIVWVYYSAQILLLGAEFTCVYAHDHGSRATKDGGGPRLTVAPAGS
ncbi:MAG: YihY/virulence factor BrkB family protein [Polyangiaceae bacterium]